MTIDNQDFDIFQGAFKDVRWSVTGLVNAADVSAARFRLSRAGTLKIEKTLGAGITVSDQDPTHVWVALTLTDLETGGLDGVMHQYQLRVSNTAGRPDFVAVGIVNVREAL